MQTPTFVNFFSRCQNSLVWKNGILLPKLFWPTVRKNCSSDLEKLLKFEAEGQELTKVLRSLEQFVRNSERSEQFLVTECFSNLFPEVYYIWETSRNKLKTKNWSDLSLFEQSVLVISKCLQILVLQPRISKVFLDH